MPVFTIRHVTQYRYDRPVQESANQLKIYPATRAGQETTQHILHISTDPLIHRFTDFWGNGVAVFCVNKPHQELTIDNRLIVKTSLPNTQSPWSLSHISDWEAIKNAVRNDLRLLDSTIPDVIQSGERIRAMIAEVRHARDTPAIFAQRCSEYIFENFTYQKGITTVETTLDEVLEHQSGVCQDFAHVLLQLLRTEGIPSRYVSGYICPNQDGARGAGATHAWVEVWLPNIGWAGLDPTNNCWVSDRHVALAVGRHFGDCSPVKGTFKGPANQTLFVLVSVGYEDGRAFEEENEVMQGAKELAAVRKQEMAQQQ